VAVKVLGVRIGSREGGAEKREVGGEKAKLWRGEKK
jgi:hypothetical protein